VERSAWVLEISLSCLGKEMTSFRPIDYPSSNAQSRSERSEACNCTHPRPRSARMQAAMSYLWGLLLWSQSQRHYGVLHGADQLTNSQVSIEAT
jgi:hypothetical protein